MAAKQCRYKPEYCAALIDHMKQGLSYEAFAGVIGVDKKTLYNWEKKFEEFAEAKGIAVEHSRLWWEKEGLRGLWNQSGEGSLNINTTMWIFNMKNRFGWRDQIQHEVTAIPVIQLKYSVDDKDEETKEAA